MSIFIEQVLVGGEPTDILIQGNTIAGIGTHLQMPANALRLSGNGLAAFPAFANAHTHAAMSLFRGYGDDNPLDIWLNNWIWPKERQLDDDIVYWGTRLACLEMVKSGTCCFNDMYFFLPAAARAIHDSGLRATLGLTVMDFHDPAATRQKQAEIEQFDFDSIRLDSRIQTAIAPHAIYTVSGPMLQWCANFSREAGMRYHIHMSETEKEVSDCLQANGCRPYEYLHRLGILEQLQDTFIGAHSLHLSAEEIALLGRNRANVVHNPNSNLKLASGHAFPYSELRQHGANAALGTDGCSSSNNLDMIEAAKTASLLQKGWRHDPTVLPAAETLAMATQNGYRAMGLNGGVLEPGALADLFMVSLDNLAFVPNNNTLSNLIYAAHGDAVDTLICDGQILMQHRHVQDEALIVEQARRAAQRLLR